MLARWLDERDAGRTNLYVLDIRQVAEYRAGHLPGAIALPGGLAVQRTDEFLPVRAAQVVLVDDDEARAALAGYWLRAMGLPRVAVLAGGLPAWNAAGYALGHGLPTMPTRWRHGRARRTTCTKRARACSASTSIRRPAFSPAAPTRPNGCRSAAWKRGSPP
ncbi:rhodanese-like domain-containing protein, partial [Bordetella pertussis]